MFRVAILDQATLVLQVFGPFDTKKEAELFLAFEGFLPGGITSCSTWDDERGYRAPYLWRPVPPFGGKRVVGFVHPSSTD